MCLKPEPVKIISFCLIILSFSSISFTRDFYVSPSGDDRNPGTIEKSFVTITGARDAIRALPPSERKQDINVYFREGVYYLKETVVFGLENGAPDGSKITYQAYRDETPLFSSGVSVSGWTRLKMYPKTLPKTARGNVWVAEILEGIGRFYTIYDREKRLDRARSNGFRPLRKEGANEEDLRSMLYFPEGTIKDRPNLEDAELLIIPQPWTKLSEPILTTIPDTEFGPDPDNPGRTIAIEQGSWDSKAVHDPGILPFKGKYLLYYKGHQAGDNMAADSR